MNVKKAGYEKELELLIILPYRDATTIQHLPAFLQKYYVITIPYFMHVIKRLCVKFVTGIVTIVVF